MKMVEKKNTMVPQDAIGKLLGNQFGLGNKLRQSVKTKQIDQILKDLLNPQDFLLLYPSYFL